MKKKWLYILILSVLAVSFSGLVENPEKAEAQVPCATGNILVGNRCMTLEEGRALFAPGVCLTPNPGGVPLVTLRIARAQCATGNVYMESSNLTAAQVVEFFRDSQTQGSGVTDTLPPDEQLNEFQRQMKNVACVSLTNFDLAGCLVNFLYYVFYVLASAILAFSAYFFNSLVALGLSSKLIADSTFITAAWAVVRDLSNVFFILVLLYIAFQTILGLGSHSGPKKMIAQVIIMALLINFSMFLTKIIIDTGNIIALVFYNKINVETRIDGQARPYEESVNAARTGVVEKDISGGMTQAFNPANSLTWGNFFEKARTPGIGGTGRTNNDTLLVSVPTGMMMLIILVSGAVMLFAAYAFFIGGISFLGRLIELWILIIFSPFAFMSSTLPILGHVPEVGWDTWLKKLIATSFMAPIFMFFMYLIFKVVNAKPFGNMLTDQGPLQTLLLVVIPAMVILSMLIMATKYAKKGSGQFGEMAIGAVKGLAALSIGGAALGGALIGRKTLGSFMKGASTGDTMAGRIQENQQRIQRSRDILADPQAGRWQKFKARKEIVKANAGIKVGVLQQASGFDFVRQKVGGVVNKDQKDNAHAAHERHDLDVAAREVTEGKKQTWDDLTGRERFEAKRKMARDKVVRDNAGSGGALTQGAGIPGFGTRKWDALTTDERNIVYDHIGLDSHGEEDRDHGYDFSGPEVNDVNQKIVDARAKQGLFSNVLQSTVTGTYDLRGLANVIAKEQSTGFAKIAMALTGAVAMGMRGGFKALDVNYGTAQNNFLKDLGNTITDALKSVKVNVDLSKVGEEKKEDHKGGGGHH